MSKCKITTCERKINCRGFCRMHYVRLMRHGELKSVQLRGQYEHCSVEGCFDKHSAKSFCQRHYQQICNWGHIVSDEERLARYRARPRGIHPAKGRKVQWAAEHIAAIKKANTGRQAWNYNGGSGTKRHQDMGRIEYKQWRDAVFARDNYTCQFCEQYSGVLHADHIQKWSENEELRYSVDNGRTLCVPCHYYITFKRKMKPGMQWCNFTARERG